MTDKTKEEKDLDLEQTETAENPTNEGDVNKDADLDVQEEKDPEAKTPEDNLSKENQELKDKYVRLYSEFENFRRRTAKERLDLVNTASQELIQEILPVIDDFERSFKAQADAGEDDQKQEGSRLIYNKLLRVLTSKGLEPMKDLVGKDFDAEYHEAITQIPAPSEDLKGKIVDVVEKGYTMGGKVVRFAKVVIGK
ncbi:nucleotide exchange factor GrpE [Cyclobacterium plantarum]|uniref:Protein GrpE n=1 Tax=Cyclobacterium plantarum TaxID=2716263 RepID=A0ABX0H367_9BACT|nr:nucleotide exchange factor GrpE [Cyclobacterium plantarum]NHE55313.1 nucleotide exchange factor GrpE [Cyclobacterium plantarum]